MTTERLAQMIHIYSNACTTRLILRLSASEVAMLLSLVHCCQDARTLSSAFYRFVSYLAACLRL